MTDLNAFPEYPDCQLCHDNGLALGYDQFPFQFCACPAGERLRQSDPDAAFAANKARAKVLEIGKHVAATGHWKAKNLKT